MSTLNNWVINRNVVNCSSTIIKISKDDTEYSDGYLRGVGFGYSNFCGSENNTGFGESD